MASRSGAERTGQTRHGKPFREIRVQPRTSATEGYGTTTNMRGGHANAAEFERQQQQAEELANLATVTAAYRQAIAELSIRNSKCIDSSI